MKVNFNRRLPALIISAVFLFAGIKVPLIHFASARTQTMDLGETGQNVQLQIETLEDSEVIDGEEAEDLKETMNQIMEKADRNAPGKTFEAIDQMREKLKNSAQKAMQTARDEQGELNRIDKLNRELESALNSNNSGAAKSISEEIKNELDKSAAAKKMGSGLNEGFSKAADSFASGAQNSKEELTKAVQELKDYIRQRTEELKQMSDKLQKARLVDRKTFEELKKQQQSGGKNGGKGASDKDSELIMAPSDSDRNGMSSDGSANGGEGPSDKNGMAGVSTDGGHPPLKYNRKTSEHNAGYKDEKLPDPGIGSIEDSVAIGAGVAAPLTEEGPLTSGQGSVSDFQAFDKSSGQNKMLLPRHRNPVKRYFSND